MAKKKSAARKHKTFRLTEHSYTRSQVLLLTLLSITVGIFIGLLLGNKVVSLLGY